MGHHRGREALLRPTHTAARALVRLRPPPSPPVLVVGNGRSGTSWVGETLGRAQGVAYYREPCHPALHGITGDAADAVWARYVPPDGHDRFFARALGAAFAGVPGPGGDGGMRGLPARLRHPPRVVVKEVATYASLEWVARTWSPQTVVLVRHPGAYVASVLDLGRPLSEVTRLHRLLGQQGVRSRLPAELCAHLDGVHDPVGAAAAAWAVRNLLTLPLLAARQDWTLVRYEDLAADPSAGFESLYAWVGLPFDDRVAEWIRSRSTVEESGAFATARVSAERIDAWRRRLGTAEVARVREVLEPCEVPVYFSPADW
jgi:hypothetical protein